MPSPRSSLRRSSSRRSRFFWLLNKEWRELLSSRAWWLFLCLVGPLVGISFISAVHTYAEASGLNGTSAGVGEAFSTLIGIWAPTFSACELAAAFLLPFVVIRQIAGDYQSGAIKIESQSSLSALTRIAAKTMVLTSAWIIASIAPLLAVGLWKIYGGDIYLPELSTVAFGHLLNAGLMIALASVAAAITEHPATAAIVTLAITVGSWIVNFIAAVQGGWWEQLAAYTPSSIVAEFQHGLVRMNIVLIAGALILAGLALASIWIRIGLSVQKRIYMSLALAASATVVIFCCSFVSVSWDASENRMNSFSRADEAALRTIRGPLHIEAHLAPEDPRRIELERRTLSRLRRIMPDLHVEYVSRTSIGLFEQNSADYGEIFYHFDARKSTSRVTTPEGVLEAIYSLTGVTPPEDNDAAFRGHPLAVQPRGAAWIFYLLWPAMAVTCGILVIRRHS